MKQLLAFSIGLFICGTSLAQKGPDAGKKTNPNKSGVSGTIKDMRRQPVEGVRAFVYMKDTIVSSGYTDATGYYETGFTAPGVYNLKLVYPSDKVMIIQAVPVKRKAMTILDLKTPLPEADTTIAYSAVAPAAPVGKASASK